MKRGRKALVIPTVDWKCRIPADIAIKVDTLLLDPVRGLPQYGARSELVTRLLREFLSRYEKASALDALAPIVQDVSSIPPTE